MIIQSKALRKQIASESPLRFALVYLAQYINFPFASFHKEVNQDLINDEIKRLILIMFRESAKTAIAVLFYILWSICYNKRHFIILASEDEGGAVKRLSMIIRQLQGNQLLINDFGELYHEKRYYNKGTFKKKTIKEFETTNEILLWTRGTGQPVRGRLYNQHRPDLFVADDMESMINVNTLENRNALDNWYHLFEF